MKNLTPETVRQYQREERVLISKRYNTSKTIVSDLLNVMKQDTIAPIANVHSLRKELAQFYKTQSFLNLNNP